YYDPSNPVAANEMNTIVSASMENSKCELVTSRMMQSSNPEIVESPLNFKLYPNPNNGSMKFDYQLSDDQNGTIVIYDVSGRKISQYVLEHSKTTMNITEDGLQNGIYFYEVIVNDKIVSTNKIVIIK
ncbi:MAG: T9SS type A sorting domain-containing protein, partial [Nitrososphaeraceae archaeon]